MADLAYRAWSRAGLNTVLRRLRPGAPVLCFHNVVATGAGHGDPGLHMTLDRFLRQVEWVATTFAVVPLDELARRARDGRSLRGLAAITFDDAYVGAIRNALPALRRLGLPSTVFVVGRALRDPSPFWWDWEVLRSAVGDQHARSRLLLDLGGDAARIAESLGGVRPGPLPVEYIPASVDEIRAHLTDLVSLGAHSMSHRALTQLDDATAHEELTTSRAVVEQAFGVTVSSLAYPYGLWDNRVAGIARTAGYTVATTLEHGDVTPGPSTLTMPRVNVPANISQHAFETWISGLHRFLP